MPKKELKQIHGKEETSQPTTLDQIWGDTGLNTNYPTFDQEEYQKQLSEMTKTDLFAHAVRVGIIPVDDREQLNKRLMKEFARYTASYRRPVAPQTKHTKPTKTVLKILSEGR